MADVSQWYANELKNLKLDELNLSDERGKRTAKIMSAVKKKFDSHDTTINKNTAAIGSWTDNTRTDTLRDAVEQLESDVASIVTGSQTVDMETIIDTDDELFVNPGLLNWQKTEKGGAVSCYPVPSVTIHPFVDFAFTETPPAEGDKAHDNPSTITGVSSIKVTKCGKNLCPLIGESSNSYISVSFTDNGEFVFNGSYVDIVDVYVFNKIYNTNLFPDYLERGKTYTFSLQGDNSSVGFQVYVLLQGNNYGGAVVSIAPGESQTYTIPNTQSMILRFSIPANTVLNNAKFKLQIEEGSSATEFEPYAGTDYTLPLGSTYYGGTVDLATGVMTVTYNGIVLNGTEGWMAGVSGNYNCYTLSISPNAKSVARLENCTHFLAEGTLSTDTEHFYATGGGVHFFSIQPDLASWKSWLAAQSQAGTPVIFTYFIDPYTVQLTPQQILSLAQTDKYTPRLNTIYTDAQAVQIGYVKSPIRSEYELTQAIIATEGGE